MCWTVPHNTLTWGLLTPAVPRVSASGTPSSRLPLSLIPFVSCFIGILFPRFLNLEWMAERRWQTVIWIRCFTRRRFSSSRNNCMGVVLGGTSRMTIPGNSTVLRAAIVVDPAEPTQRFRPDCRKWAIRFCISMRSSTAPTIPSSKSSAYRT
ncbi:unnamed protein product [Vicia faba]|uniref:Uncharacterized protein n=1 Tax=Vicia faba TaxID=3906 RepID=R4IUE4_VICFA|nr:hypothetical protein [Vicia faba]CAI8608422.1 unnamed protein product [Vicia faba]